MTTTRVLQFGLGSIGRSIARLVHEKPVLELVGGIDSDPLLQGLDLGHVIGLDDELGLRVSADASTVLAELRPEVVILSTGSFLRDVQGQIQVCLATGANVVSTCEELSFPSPSNAGIWATLDSQARAAGVRVLGTGVNPGFAMDALPLFLTAIVERIELIDVHRIQNAATRRLSLRRKIGLGLSPKEFEARVKDGGFGHIGLLESALLVADRLRLELDDLRTTLTPRLCQQTILLENKRIKPGQVSGIHQTVLGERRGKTILRLVLDMAVDVGQSRDQIRIEGSPPINLLLEGGLHGDVATRAITTNAIPRVLAASPGLLTMVDMPIPFAIAAV